MHRRADPGLKFSRGGGGGQVFPGDGVPKAHSYRNPLSLMIFQGGGVPDTPPYGSVLEYPKMEGA